MLLLIGSTEYLNQFLYSIQIHLMLLLIVETYGVQDALWHSNTSHVTINRLPVDGNVTHGRIQIHLMLLLIKTCQHRRLER